MAAVAEEQNEKDGQIAIENKGTSPSNRIKALRGQLSENAVEELLVVTTSLNAVLTATGSRSIWHDTIPGTADLDVLAKEYLHIGQAICDSQYTPLQTRLHWGELWDRFYNLYKACEESAYYKPFGAVLRRLRDTTLGCPCCSGVPAAVFTPNFDDGLAYHFTEEQFEKLWPSQNNVGGRYGKDYARVAASQRMIEKALASSGAPS